jgi:hypothetical protein
MTLEELREHFSAIGQTALLTQLAELTPDKYGVIVVSRIDLLDKNDRAHVGQLLFVDSRIAHFRVIYDNYTDQFAWEDVDQFVEKMAASLSFSKSWVWAQSLPLEENHEIWSAKYDLLSSTVETYRPYWDDTNEEERFLLCDDILVSAGVPLPGKRHWTNGAFIQFDDLIALRKMRTQMGEKSAEEERKEREVREQFKP